MVQEVDQDDGLGGAILYALHEMGGVDAYVNSPSFSQLLESDKAECKLAALEQLLRGLELDDHRLEIRRIDS